VALKAKDAIDLARRLYGYHLIERERLDVVRRYYKGIQARPMVIPTGSPREVLVMARSSRVNVMPIVVNSLVQSMFVDGYRAKLESENSAVWDAWQWNQMDARQTGINRATFQFGTSYVTVRPSGGEFPLIEGKSPRVFTAIYGDDPKWPIAALEKLGKGLWRLYDESAFYYVQLGGGAASGDQLISSKEHEFEVTPAIRYVDEEDLDSDDEPEPDPGSYTPNEVCPVLRGQVTPLMPIQDQIDLTTFDLEIAKHYGAFRQRYVIGWTAKSEQEAVKAAASKLWSFKDDPESIKLGEFGQTDLGGYIESREASLRHAATLSQTPVHELTGQVIQMSAEALAAADAGRDRKINERQTVQGESHEQMLSLVAKDMGVDVPSDAQVVWRDTSTRTFAATIDGLGKIAAMLQVPPQELWERIPGVTRQDLERWKAAAEEANSFDSLTALLERQAKTTAPPTAAVPATT
jgi:Phage portal protein, SPP1 Gp6-like